MMEYGEREDQDEDEENTTIRCNCKYTSYYVYMNKRLYVKIEAKNRKE